MIAPLRRERTFSDKSEMMNWFCADVAGMLLATTAFVILIGMSMFSMDNVGITDFKSLSSDVFAIILFFSSLLSAFALVFVFRVNPIHITTRRQLRYFNRWL